MRVLRVRSGEFSSLRFRPRPFRRRSWVSVIVVVVIAIAGWVFASNVDLGGLEAKSLTGSTGLTVASSAVNVLPNIAQILNFTITGNTSGDSGPFDAASSDTLVVFVELFGKTTVNNVSVEDGPNDTFVQEAYLLDYVNGGTHGFSVWASTNISGGPNTDVNVTLKGGTTDSAAIEVVDVNGGNPYGGNPVPFVDQVADIIHGNSNSPNEYLTVHDDDLALAGIGTWSWNNFSALSPAALGDQVTTNSSVTGSNVTAAVLYYSNDNSTTEPVWMNATLTSRAPWIEDIITIGAVDYTTQYSVTFSEVGLPAGTTWCQTVQSQGPTQCGTTGSTWSVQDGIYDWNISVESEDNYIDANLGNSGYLTVQGAPVAMDFNFSDPLSCGGTHQPACIQHVVIIMMENQQRLTVESNGPTEKWLASTYEGASSFSSACHPSAPNYLSLISATTNQCSKDLYPGTSNGPPSGKGPLGSWRNMTLADLLQNHSAYVGGPDFTWANYAEDLPSDACTNPQKYDTIQSSGNSGTVLFFSKHVPFLYEADTVYSSSFCQKHILSLEPGKFDSSSYPSFNTSVADGTMFNFSFITPNACDDGHNLCGSGVRTITGPNATCSNNPCRASTTASQVVRYQADPWLRWFLGGLMNCTGAPYSATSHPQAHANCLKEMAHTVFFILYDEGSGGATTRSTNDEMTYATAPGETANNNAWWCSGDKFPAHYIATCGNNPFVVTVIHNVSLASGHGLSFFSAKTSEYGITATIEWLFGLGDFATAQKYLPGLSNPGGLDKAWTADRLNLGGPDSPKDEFSFSTNGY